MPKTKNAEKDFLAPEKRAEDIILGALGFGEEAKIVSITATPEGFSGKGVWPDGESFSFESEDAPSDLERWAIGVLQGLTK